MLVPVIIPLVYRPRGTFCLFLPLSRMHVFTDHRCNHRGGPKVIYPVTVIKKEGLVRVIVHPLRGSPRPKPVAQEIPTSPVTFQQIPFNMRIQELQPPLNHLKILFQYPSIAVIFIHDPGQGHHDSTPRGASSPVVGRRCLRQYPTAQVTPTPLLFSCPFRIVHVPHHRLGPLHVSPIFQPLGVKSTQLVIQKSRLGSSVRVTPVPKPLPLGAIHYKSTEREVLERPHDGVINPVL